MFLKGASCLSTERRLQQRRNWCRCRGFMHLTSLLEFIESTVAYTVLISFYGLYPIVTCLIYVVTAIIYKWRRPITTQPVPENELPFVSVIIPAYCEEAVIGRSVEATLAIDYPRFEILVVNDGSTDETADKVRPFLKDSRCRLLD